MLATPVGVASMFGKAGHLCRVLISDRQTVDLMSRAVEDAWRELQTQGALTPETLEDTHEKIVRAVLSAVEEGESDQSKLKLAALRAAGPGLDDSIAASSGQH